MNTHACEQMGWIYRIHLDNSVSSDLEDCKLQDCKAAFSTAEQCHLYTGCQNGSIIIDVPWHSDRGHHGVSAISTSQITNTHRSACILIVCVCMGYMGAKARGCQAFSLTRFPWLWLLALIEAITKSLSSVSGLALHSQAHKQLLHEAMPTATGARLILVWPSCCSSFTLLHQVQAEFFSLYRKGWGRKA